MRLYTIVCAEPVGSLILFEEEKCTKTLSIVAKSCLSLEKWLNVLYFEIERISFCIKRKCGYVAYYENCGSLQIVLLSIFLLTIQWYFRVVGTSWYWQWNWQEGKLGSFRSILYKLNFNFPHCKRLFSCFFSGFISCCFSWRCLKYVAA